MSTNTTPAALNDYMTVIENSTSNQFDPRDNDFILSTNPATFRIQSLPSLGVITVSPTLGAPYIVPTIGTPYDGNIDYVPTTGAVGSDFFTYDLVNDIGEISNTGSVNITVKARKPTSPTVWAENLLANGPLGGPNRKDPTLDKQQAGFAWGEKPSFSTLNGWMYNVGELVKWLADSIDRLDVDIGSVSKTSSDSLTIGINDADPKTLFAGTGQLLNPYISFKPDPISGIGRWFASDTGNPSTEYPLEHPRGITEEEVVALILQYIDELGTSGAQSKFFDLRPNGVLTEAQARSIASAQYPTPAQGDLMAVQFTEAYQAYYGNGTGNYTRTRVQNYIFTGGAFTPI